MRFLSLFRISLLLCWGSVEAWSNDEYELFDLVEEVNKNFYELLEIPNVCIIWFKYSQILSVLILLLIDSYGLLLILFYVHVFCRMQGQLTFGKLFGNCHWCCIQIRILHLMQMFSSVR